MGARSDGWLRDTYLQAVRGIDRLLVARCGGYSGGYKSGYKSSYTVTGERNGGGAFSPKFEHLACFAPGMLGDCNLALDIAISLPIAINKSRLSLSTLHVSRREC